MVMRKAKAEIRSRFLQLFTDLYLVFARVEATILSTWWIRRCVDVRGVTPDKFLSQRERDMRDSIMLAVRKKIAKDRIPCAAIMVSGRPMLTKLRERIMRSDVDFISLKRSILIADAVGIEFDFVVEPKLVAEAAAAKKAKEIASARRQLPRRVDNKFASPTFRNRAADPAQMCFAV